MIETFPPFYKKGKTFTPKRDNKSLHYFEGATMTKIHLVDFNPASHDHIAEMLIKKYGAKLLTEFLTLNKRCGQIAEGAQAWLNHKAHGSLRAKSGTGSSPLLTLWA
jgi:hypothetical protein